MKKIYIKPHNRKDGKEVRGYWRIKQVSLFKNGYLKAIKDINKKMGEINKKEKEHYWKWQFLGCYLDEKLGIKK